MNAAAPALTLPTLKGNDRLAFVGLTKHSSFAFQLPGKAPLMHVRMDKRTEEIYPSPDRILVDLESLMVQVVWRGTALTTKPVPNRFPTPDDTMASLMHGIEVFVEGKEVAPLS
jgi:hypothetical protein